MGIAIIVEGESDKVIVETVLKSVISTPPFGVVAAGGRSSAVSLARSYFTLPGSLFRLPGSLVALLVDADTVDSQQVQEQQRILTDSLAAVAPTWAFEVFVAVPEIESCLFADREALKAVVGESLTDEMLIQARFQPKVVLQKLLRDARLDSDYSHAVREVLSKLPSLNLLAASSPLKELRNCIDVATSRRFRWPERTALTLPDRSTITIEPSLYRSSQLKNVKTPRQAMTLRFYKVRDASGQLLDEKSELDLTNMLGEDAPSHPAAPQ
jgi:hypothetical protein